MLLTILIFDSMFSCYFLVNTSNLKSKKIFIRSTICTSSTHPFISFEYLKGFLIQNTFRMVLPEEEKMEFVRAAVTWMSGMNIMDNSFVLNFGYEALFPWPQVYSDILILNTSLRNQTLQKFLRVELSWILELSS